MRGLGTDRFLQKIEAARRNDREDETTYGRHLLRYAIDPLEKGIREFLAEAETGKAGRRRKAVHYLRLVNPDVAAVLTLRVILSRISMKDATVTRTALQIAAALEHEVKFQALHAEQPALLEAVKRRMVKTHSTHRGYRMKTLAKAADRHASTDKPWPVRDCLHLGIALLHLVEVTTGIIKITHRFIPRRGKAVTKGVGKRQEYVEPSEKTVTWITKKVEWDQVLYPLSLPMVAPPLPWTSPMVGGYHTDAVPRLPMVKPLPRSQGRTCITPKGHQPGYRHDAYLDELAAAWDDMPTVIEAINAVQATPWRINTAVLPVLQQAIDQGQSIGKLPPGERLPKPPCPECGSLVGPEHPCFQDPEVLKAWKRKTHLLHNSDVGRRARLIQARQIERIANRFKDAAAIWFPHQMDFRGRLYPVPMLLNPQGNDIARGLLTFAEGQPINDHQAAGWLAIHGANVYGIDKVGFEDRIAWVQQHEDRILAIADDPWADLWWTEADKPWQFLAFCFEWQAFQQHGLGFVSSLPVAMDGSCNGLQHFSAMLRDPVGGLATNLTPTLEPQDIYQIVADRTEGLLIKAQHDAEPEEVEMINHWLQLGINRKTVKRSVMVVPYSGTRWSCREYIQDWLVEELEARRQRGEECPPWEGRDLFQASNFLTRHVWEAIGRTVVAAREVMAWLQKAARRTAKEELSIYWTTPVGFPVRQDYREMNSRVVETLIGDRIFKPRLQEETEKMDKDAQANGISPNFVHSLDAAALQLSVVYAKEAGLTSFSMVHDSYAAPAAHADTLAACLREAFVDIYEQSDPLEDLKASLEAIIGEPLPALPAKGSLDLGQVRESPFFFA